MVPEVGVKAHEWHHRRGDAVVGYRSGNGK
jgi:hypothetical protein